MRPFIHDDFLLQSESARDLYHSFAAGQPIYDYHCHLSPRLIADNHRFDDLFEIWLAGDHYKWRAMRTNGVPERFCTGDATPWEKFSAWAATVPYTLRNPLYHWSHLELKRYFDIDTPLRPETAREIWEQANAHLPQLRVHDILAKHRVAVICTTDDPADALHDHARIRASNLPTRVYPTFRPDRALALGDPSAFNTWCEQLEGAAAMPIATLDDLLTALERRHAAFHEAGCRISDHGLETALAEPCTHAEAHSAFAMARSGRSPSIEDQARYGSYLMHEFGRWDARRGWTKQLHLGAMRNNNGRLRRQLGPDTGFDSIGDFSQARALARYLDALDQKNELPRIVLYNLNPANNYVFATMLGNFQDGSVAGKLQFGSGWWFLDQKEAMEWQLNALSNNGLLRRFVGMITDSRSFMSFPRHDYFRRVLCNLLGREMECGELPTDRALIGALVREVSFTNARDYFRLELAPEYLSPTSR